MWKYEKRLQFPVNIKNPNATLAQAIMSQYGGPDGELGASMRYLSQRYSMPYREVAAILTDIGTEELAHLEMGQLLCADIRQNGGNLTIRHGIALGQIAHGSAEFSVRTSVLAHDGLCKCCIWIFDINREL